VLEFADMVKICKECGTVLHESAFRVAVKITRADGSSAQRMVEIEHESDITGEVAWSLLDRAKEQLAKMKP
jgi:hypothetical protein